MDGERRPFQFRIADLLALMLIVAFLGATSRLPISVVHAIPMFAVLYLAKFRILSLRVRPWLALGLYCLAMAALLPYLYFRVIDVWDYTDVDPRVNWIGVPVMAFTVPTTFFLYDTLDHKYRAFKFYAIRTALELVVLVPVWTFIWGCVQLFVFEWVAI